MTMYLRVYYQIRLSLHQGCKGRVRNWYYPHGGVTLPTL